MREAALWTLHLAAGVVILVFLSIHMGIMHLEDVLAALGTGYRDALGWASVVMRNKQLYFTITYVILLAAALYHGLYGLRNILLELGPGPTAVRVIQGILILLGASLFVLGTIAAIAAYVR
jgi:succinate dehydrogenase / fumarate reductase membrane anchor subunit